MNPLIKGSNKRISYNGLIFSFQLPRQVENSSYLITYIQALNMKVKTGNYGMKTTLLILLNFSNVIMKKY